MNSRDSNRAPSRRPPSVRAAALTGTGRVRVKPRRDALTRVRHDLRSLVHAVVGYSDLLANDHYGPMGSEQRSFVEHVRAAASQLEELVDVCVELSRPSEQIPVAASSVAIGALVPRLRHHLASHALACDVQLAPALEGHSLAVDIELTERALLELARVVTRERAPSCVLRVHEQRGRLVLELAACRTTQPSELSSVDALENELINRDFVRVKLAEVLLARQSLKLRISPERDFVELS